MFNLKLLSLFKAKPKDTVESKESAQPLINCNVQFEQGRGENAEVRNGIFMGVHVNASAFNDTYDHYYQNSRTFCLVVDCETGQLLQLEVTNGLRLWFV